MKEVSCRILEMFFAELARKGLPPSKLIEGVGYPLEHFKNKDERIDWSAFILLMKNAEKIWTEDDLIAIGGAWIDSPFIRYLRVIAGTLFDARQVYHWFDSRTKGARKGISVQMFTCVTVAVSDAGRDRVRLVVDLDPGYEFCRAFFLLTKGGYVQLPRMVNQSLAKVDMTWTERGAVYDVTLPEGASRTNIKRRVQGWFTGRSAAARELDEAYATLQVRYEELDVAREKLAKQAAQLRTAHTVNAIIQKDIDLDVTVAAIARTMIDEAGFVQARIEIDTEVDGVRIARAAEHGVAEGDPFELLIIGHGEKRTGKITVRARPNADRAEREELLAFIVPSIAMAVDNAISYRVVEDYRRGLELRVAERTAELSTARDDLAVTVNDLERAKEVRDRIFANINHDLRSPLSLILLSVSEARRSGSFDDTAEQTLGAIEHGARRVLRMVDELLILAQGREGELRLSTTVCDLSAMVATVVDAWKPAAGAAGLELVAAITPDARVQADPNALERILANLVSNAIKFTPQGGTIRVGVTCVDNQAKLEVVDNGPGIDADLRARLFGRFERGASARTGAINGSGLGLSLVKELTEAHGGSVVAVDAPGGGALFRVLLPLTEQAPTSVSAPLKLRAADYGISSTADQETRTYEPPKGVTPRARILLAEDDPELRDRTARLLAQDYLVYAAPDGAIALEIAKQRSPDLLVTDIAMPNMDGIELTKKFRAMPNNRVAPVLVLTTFGGIADRLSGFEAGAVDYIHKPFEPAELRARVRSQLTLRSVALQLLESEKLAALGTLSAGLAHEIRNPANGIINAVGPLRELLPPEAIAPDTAAGQLLDIVEHCSNQVAAMSRQLLGFKRGVEPKRQSVSIESLVSRVCTTVTPMLEGVELREAFDYRGSIYCAEPLMAQVLTNLVQNGAHAAGRGGWVEVRTQIDTASVVVEVRDSGPGVPDELRERIFEPFFTTKPAGVGTGLGLSTSREIVLRHGGSLDVRNSGGKSVFRVEIPLPS